MEQSARRVQPVTTSGGESENTWEGSGGEHDQLVQRGCSQKDDCWAVRRRNVAFVGCTTLLVAAAAVLGYAATTNGVTEAYIDKGKQSVSADVAALENWAFHSGARPAAAYMDKGKQFVPADVDNQSLHGRLRPAAVSAPPYVTFVTAETRGEPLLKSVLNFTGNFTSRLINLGMGHKWDGYKTKVELMADWLTERAAAERQRDPAKEGQELVAFVDGSDVFWGGCDPDYFVRSYQEIVDGSGAQIVFGAGVVCGEQDCNAVPQTPSWASAMGGRDLNSSFWKKFAHGCRRTWSDECAAKRDCGFWAPCSVPPAVKFLNSGFIIGPVQALKEMVDWTIQNYDNTSVWGDQSTFAVYWLENQANVTLDYTGALAISLSDMSHDLMKVDREAEVVWNGAFNHVQCLIHGNGRGIFLMKHVLKMLTGKNLTEVRGW